MKIIEKNAVGRPPYRIKLLQLIMQLTCDNEKKEKQLHEIKIINIGLTF